MASAVATPLESQFSTIAGVSSMTSQSTSGLDQDHAAVRPRPQYRRAPRRTCRPPSARRRASCRTNMPTPPSLSKGQSGRLADPLHRAELAARCRCRRSTSMPRRCWRAHLDGGRRGAGQGLRRAEIRGARAGRSRGAGRARHRHRRRSRPPSQNGQRQPADRHAVRRARRRSLIQANGQLLERRALPPP